MEGAETKWSFGMDPNFEWRTRNEKLEVVAYWWREQRGLCCICHHKMKPYSRQHSTDQENATIEHIIPRRGNGPNNVGNVRLAHARCNHALGALWEMNKNRIKRGLEPLSEKWAVNSALGNQRARERMRKEAKDESERKNPGVSWCAANALHLPRGATLLPEVTRRLAGEPTNRAPKPKMTATETARWLAERGVRGA